MVTKHPLASAVGLLIVGLTLSACSSDNSGPQKQTKKPTSPQLSLTLSAPKTFEFHWQASLGATEYRLHEAADTTDPNFQWQTLATLDANARHYNHSVPLYARLNAQYLLEACNANGCTDSQTLIIDPSQPDQNNLVEAIGYFKASNTEGDTEGTLKGGDLFGFALSLSGNGQVLAVGASKESSADKGVSGSKTGADSQTAPDSGAVYLFRKAPNGQWQQQAYIKASNTGAEDNFGISVALNDDGTVLAVGAILEDSADTGVKASKTDDSTETADDNFGAVYLFVAEDTVEGGWKQQAYVKASNTGTGDFFGSAVSLNAAGTVLAVGAHLEDSADTGVMASKTGNDAATASNSGAVYLFVADDNAEVGWKQQAYIKASNTGEGDKFGESVALNAAGTVLAVGAKNEDSADTGVAASKIDGDTKTEDNSGAVYLFVADDNAEGGWKQQAYVKASNTGTSDFFGGAVSLNATGTVLAVGARDEDSADTGVAASKTDDDTKTASNSGAVYLFVADTAADGGWKQQAYVKASNTGANNWFSTALSLNAAGTVLAVGATYEDSADTGVKASKTGDEKETENASGAVYLFVADDTAEGGWKQQAYVKASNTGSNDHFGTDVSLNAAGTVLAVGAKQEGSAATGIGGQGPDINGNPIDNPQANNEAPFSGAVYLY